MAEINTEDIKENLKEIFNVSKIERFEAVPNITVNKLFFFEISKKKFVMKILVRKPATENEFYRFEKEATILNNFTKLNNIQGYSLKEKIFVPVPKIVHIENNEEKIGYKFIIMEFIEGVILEKLWNELNINEKSEIILELAKIVKSIHSIKYEMFGQIEDYDCPRRFYSFESMLITDIRKYGRLVGVKDILPIKLITKAIEFVENNVSKIKFKTKPTLVHNDLNLSNVIVRKNNRNQWSIVAILDFEWSFAGNPLSDLFNIQEEILVEKKLQKIFFTEYFGNKHLKIEDFQIEKKINTIKSLLESLAIGWIHFHPTKENIEYVKDTLEKILDE
ncbi:MAG TPA: phosphotransferase [candidate division Zixibacteria bacterium]|nr:phosphotransferase [candidate division Zixibacteria bacterium]